MSYLLDTCVLSELVKPAPDASVLTWMGQRDESELFVSSITLGELQRGVARLPESRRRKELAEWLRKIEAAFDGRVLGFERNTAPVWAAMMAEAEGKGKPVAAFDSIIAATALEHRMTLVSRNVRDFASSGVKLLNPWKIE